MQEHNKKRGQLSQGERIEIYALRKQEVSLKGIVNILVGIDTVMILLKQTRKREKEE